MDYLKNNKNIDKFENKIVFNNNDQYRFVFKKHERLVSALYLITNLFSESEPLKWKIREQSLIALNQSLELKKPSPRALSELIALCRIAHISGYISEMNHTLLQAEFALLIETMHSIAQEENTPAGPVLSSEFFAMGQSKGQSVSCNQNSPIQQDFTIKDIKKESRSERILSLLKNKETLSIKDFVGVITDCSEKTIQRDLLALVQEGVLKKTGERRWSVYSLK